MPSKPRTPAIEGRLVTARTSGTKRTPSTTGMQATAHTQVTAMTKAIAVTPATSDIEDNFNSMNARNSRKASNSKNESNNRTANAVGMPAKAGTLTKLVKPVTACREANYSRDTIKSEMTGTAGTIRTSWMSTATGPSESVGKPATCSSNVSNIRTAAAAGTLNWNIVTVGWTPAETIGLSETKTAEGRPAIAGMPATEGTLTTVLLSAVTPTAETEMPEQYGRHEFS
jgi:hypothetical protein